LKRTLQDRIIQFRKDIKDMNSIGELIAYIPSQALVKLAYWLLMVMAVSPLYVMLRSLFLPYHDTFYIPSNQGTLGEYLHSLLLFVGFIGLLVTLVVSAKNLKGFTGKGWLLYTIKTNPVPFFLFLLLLWSILSCSFSDNFHLSLHGNFYTKEGLLTYLSYAGLFCCGYLVNEPKLRFMILKSFAATATFLCIISLLNINFLNRFLSVSRNGIFFNSNHYAYYLCLASMATAALALFERKFSWEKLLWILSFSILIYGLIKNNSFGPYLAVAFGLFFTVVFIVLYAKKASVSILIILTVFIVLSVITNFQSSYLHKETTKLSEGITDIIHNNENSMKAGSNRWELWVHGVRYALEKPFFGYGPENLTQRYENDGIKHSRPHNEIIQLAASLGIPAALFYIIAIASYFLLLLKNRKRLHAENFGCYGITFAYLVSSMFGVSIFYTAPFYFMFLGLTCNMFQRQCTASAQSAVYKTTTIGSS
jgi:O-antigen ligase